MTKYWFDLEIVWLTKLSTSIELINIDCTSPDRQTDRQPDRQTHRKTNMADSRFGFSEKCSNILVYHS